MKNLNKKVFFVLVLIFSFFLLLGIVLFNNQIYQRDYEDIKNNLNSIDINRIQDLDNL